MNKISAILESSSIIFRQHVWSHYRLALPLRLRLLYCSWWAYCFKHLFSSERVLLLQFMERFRVTWAISSQLCCFGWLAYWIVFSPFLRLMMHELSCPPISRLFLFFFSFRFHLCAPCLVGSACCKKFFYEASVLTNRSCRTCFWGLFHYAFCRLTTVQHAKLLVIIFSLFIVPEARFLHFVSIFDTCSPIRSLGFRTNSLMSQVSIKFIFILFSQLFFLLHVAYCL